MKGEKRTEERERERGYRLCALDDDKVARLVELQNTMLSPSNKFAQQLSKYFAERVVPRKNTIYKGVREVAKIVTEVLREVEGQEPRFISSLNEVNGRFEGLTVISQTEFEVRIRSMFESCSTGCLGRPLSESNGCIQFCR